MTKTLYLLTILSLLLAACGTLEITIDKDGIPNASAAGSIPTAVPTLDPLTLPLSMESGSETIRMKLLNSHAYLQSIWMDGRVIWYPSDGNGAATQASREQIWIDLSTSSFRRLSGTETSAEFAVISDARNILQLILKTGQSQTYPVPADTLGLFNPPQSVSDSITPHPLEGLISSPFSSMLLPAGLAQRRGTFLPAGTEMVAGRVALVVDWVFQPDVIPSRYWVDVDTGVILKALNFEKGSGGQVESEFEIMQIMFNYNPPPELFQIPPSMPSQYDDLNGTQSSPSQPVPASVSVDDPFGYVYFFTIAQSRFALVRLPGSCVLGLSECPPLATIPLPFNTGFNIETQMFSWSPDGRMAAFAVPPGDGKELSRLFIFDPFQLSWSSQVEFPFIDLPQWSRSGDWIVFRVQDGQGNSDIYAIHPDGSGLKIITESEKLPLEGRPYISDGWISNNLIIRSGRPGQEDKVYLVRVDDGFTRSLFEILQTKAPFFPSPDGSLLAFDEYDYQSQLHTLRVIAPDGSGMRDLASFSQTSFYPLAWSADISMLAFNAFRSEPPVSSSVHVIGRDGRDLRQVYVGDAISSLVFSPDDRHLLVEDGGQGKIYIVNLQSLERRILQAPGLPQDEDWRAASWQPAIRNP